MKRIVSFFTALISIIALDTNVSAQQALLVPGGANYVEVGDLDIAGDQITVEAVVTMTAVGVNIVSKHTDQSNVNYLMRPGSVEITTTNGYVNAISGFNLNIGECYHLAFTYDGTNLNYYVNGCLASSTPHTGTLIQNNLTTAIGNRSDCQCESWNGYIDEVRIWNVARTQADIQANMMDLPTPTTQAGLQAYYKFDGNYTNLQGNAAWDGIPIGAPQLQVNAACQNVDLSFQNSIVVTDVSCNGGSDGEVTITSSGGHPNYTYSVDGINYFPTTTVGGLPAGAGGVFASSGANGCVELIPVTILEPTAITTSVTGTDPTSCVSDNGTADLTVNGGTPPYTFLWSSGSTDEDPTNLAAGNNTVTITDANQCTTTESIILSAPQSLTTSITGTDPTCNGGNDGAADLTVNNGAAPLSFSWSSGSNQEDPTNLVAGNNTVTVTDANGCTAFESIVLSEPTPIFPNAYSNFVSSNGACDGGGVSNPSGGTPPYTFSWSSGGSTQAVNGLCQGPQTVTVTDANGCMGSQVVTVNVPACLTDVDFNTWVQAGQPANGNWVIQNGGAQVRQTVNGNPTFYVTPEDYINVRMRGKMRTTDSDDDFMGVVFGFKDPLGASNNFDMWLFDWKQGAQNGAPPGFTLNHAVGTIPPANYGPTFWQHNTTPEFTVVATDYGNGWNRNVDYEVEVTYTINRAIILVDGDTIFDVIDCFEPGRFGFYNYSQQDVYYSDFTYELFTDFTVEEQQVCAGDTAHLTFLQECGIFTNVDQFDELRWDYGDGNGDTITNLTLNNINSTHVYETGGNYTISLVALDTLGCRDTIYKDIFVIQNPTADFAFADQCLQDFTQFTDASVQGDYAITNWNWNFGDNGTSALPNPTHQYGAVNTYTVSLAVEDSYGCVDTTEQTVEIYVLPQADFTPIDACFSANYPFEDISTITSGTVDSWQWNFGDLATSTQQNPTHTYAGFGQYDVQLIALSNQGCGDTTTQTIILHDIPVAGFEVPSICQLQSMQFTDTSSIQEGFITNWDYDLGDNTPSIQQHPIHAYANAGPVNVELTVTSNFGCTATITLPAVVDPKPVADFVAQDVCLDETTNFLDQSTVASGNVIQWEWDFGDTNTDNVQNSTHLYTAFNIYTVELMVETDNGCRDTVEHQVGVYELPIADFSFADVCLDDDAIFTDQSTSNQGAISSWNWNLGDATTDNTQGPVVHAYATPNTYTVQLIVESGVGCADTLEQDITIYPMPEAGFTADSVCFGELTTFTNLSSILSGTMGYQWDFGFGATSTDTDPTNQFPETGYLPVTLALTSDFGCRDMLTQNVRVYVLPVPEFTHSDVCFEEDMQFANASQIAEGSIDFYNWNFGDGNASTLNDPFNHYASEGFYQVKLVATSNFGCVDSIAHQVEIYPLPQLGFTAIPAEGCQPLTVVFDNETDITTGYSVSSYEWDFGHGITSTDQSPRTVYPDSGFYDIQLIATTANGCDDTLLVADAINVWPRPIAGFHTDKEEYFMLFPNVHFTDESFGATEWLWDFADGVQGYDQNPVHEYLTDSTYQVIQTVNNDYGCDDVYSQRVIVRPVTTFYIPEAFTPNDDGINEVFAGNGVGLISYEMYVYDRWGEILFHSAKMEYGWDGTYKGQAVENGLYVYRFAIVDVDNHSHEYTGGVHLVR